MRFKLLIIKNKLVVIIEIGNKNLIVSFLILNYFTGITQKITIGCKKRNHIIQEMQILK